jgi:pentapeptide MXKDX repeat protein
MKTNLNRRIVITLAVTALTVSALSSASFAQDKMMKRDTMKHSGETMEHDKMAMHDDAMKAKLGLDGYCPVCIIDARKWEKGDPKINSTVDGISYLFPNAVIKAKFDANPQKYVPALNGDCIVCFEKYGKRVAGRVQHAALHRNRLYLFPDDQTKQAFVANPSEYAVTEEAAMKKEAMVKKDTMDKKETMMKKTSMMKDAHNGVRLVGRSGCAACEFGVTPIGAPDQLGLAVVGDNGQITVVEGAHKNYPQIYKDRFQAQRLSVEGQVVKTQGKITWVKPTSLSLIN